MFLSGVKKYILKNNKMIKVIEFRIKKCPFLYRICVSIIHKFGFYGKIYSLLKNDKNEDVSTNNKITTDNLSLEAQCICKELEISLGSNSTKAN